MPTRRIAPILIVLMAAALCADAARAAWLPDGNPICRVPEDLALPIGMGSFSCPFGPCAGALTLFWSDGRNNHHSMYTGGISDAGPPPDGPGDVPATLVRSIDGILNPAVAIPVLAVNPGSQFSSLATILVWTEYPTSGLGSLRAKRMGDTIDWGADGVAVALSSPGILGATAVPDDSGGVIVAWQSNTSLTRWCFAQRIDVLGQRRWGDNGVFVGSDTTVQTAPHLAPDGAGGVYLMREDRRGGTGALALFRLDRDGAIAPGWPADGRIVGPGSSRGLAIRARNGSVWVCRAQGVDVPPAPPSEASAPFVTRVLADGTFAPGWTVDGTAVATGRPGHCLMEDLDVAGSGDLLVSFQYRPAFGLPDPTATDLFLQHIASTGGVASGWPVEGLLVCGAPGNQWKSRMFAQGDGAFVAWSDARADNGDIYALRILPDGSRPAEWPTQGLRVCGAAGMQTLPVIAPNALGGALIAWLDQRDFTTYFNDLYGNTVTADARLDVEEAPPSRFAVAGASPNPTRSSTRIMVDLNESGDVQTEVLDVLGRRVHVSREALSAGRHAIEWRLVDDAGARVSPGLYLMRVRSGDRVAQARVVVTR